MGVRTELKMVQQAIRNGWPVSERERHKATVLALRVLIDPDATEREQKAAQATLLALRLSERVPAP